MAGLERAGPIGLPVPRPVHWPTVVVASVGMVAVSTLCIWPLCVSKPVIAVPTVLFAGALIAAGIVLRGEPGQGPAAGALILAGALWPLGWIDVWGVEPGKLVAELAAPLALVLTAWAIYRYPDPGQVGRWEHGFLRALALWIVIGRIGVSLCSDPGWHRTLDCVSAGGEAGLGLLFLGQWYARVRKVSGLDRRLMGPVAVAALVAGTASAASPVAQVARLPEPFLDVVFSVESTLLLGVPTAFAIAALRRRLTSTVIADLVQRLRGEPTPENVEDAFQHVLADPDLRVYYWSEDPPGYVDREGQSFDETAATAWLLLPVATAADEPLAVIRANQALSRYPDLVAAAVVVGALAVENVRLQVALRAQVAQVRASRARIIEAGLAERQALERDLNTGALNRILTLIDVLAQRQAQAPGELAEISGYATEQLGQVAVELQDIARGLHPSVLSTAGLVEAVCRISRAQPIPVSVDLPERPFPISVQVAAYYVISEAITNAVRHARATQIFVLGIDTGKTLLLTVKDDGCGGATTDRGTGLLGLSERLHALDGDLSVVSPEGQGTVLMAEIPCG